MTRRWGMTGRAWPRAFVAALLGFGLFLAAHPGCAQTSASNGVRADRLPAFCSFNNEARGAAIGAQRGAATGVPNGAEIGAARGAARGARLDALCRSLAGSGATPPAPVPRNPAGAPTPATQAVAVPRPAVVAAPASAKIRHAEAEPLSGSPMPAGGQHCMATSEVSFGADAAEVAPVTGRVCRGRDGRLHDR